jgi:GTP-binding protein
MTNLNSSDSNSRMNSKALITVVGRPNVGKSTLFNRLIGRRLAITDPTPGVTRDPVEAEYTIGNRSVRILDTGGFRLDGEALDEMVKEKSLQSLHAADLILFLVEVNEVTPEDESFMELLRRHADKILLVVNKVDNRNRESLVAEFYQYGFSEIIPVSAAHGEGIEELEDAILARLPAELPDENEGEEGDEAGTVSYESDENTVIRLAILGKPNTGKSTLMNTLTGEDKSIVSDMAGTTRDVVTARFSYEGQDYRIMDTAGIRRKRAVGENIEYYSVHRAFNTIEQADIIFLLVDAVEGLAEQDKKIAAQIIKKGKGVVLVLNKWDLLKEVENQMDAVIDRVRYLFPVLGFAPVIPISAKTSQGIDKLFKAAQKVWKQLNTRVDTSALNNALKRWTNVNPPSRWKRGQYKLRYMTQVLTNPLLFKVFVNRRKGFPESYKQYMRNQLRKDFQLNDVIILLDIVDSDE